MAVQVNEISSSTETKYPHLIAQIIDQYENGVSLEHLYDIFEIDIEDEEQDKDFCLALIWLENEGHIYQSRSGVYKYERDQRRRKLLNDAVLKFK